MTFPQGYSIALQVSPAGGTSGGLPPGGGGAFAANAVHFDGTNDYLLRGGALTGAADSGDIISSLWLNPAVDTGGQLLWADTSILRIDKDAGGVINVDMRTVAPAVVLQFGAPDFTIAAGWQHILWSYRSSTQVLQVYVDDVSDTLDYSVKNTGAIDWTGGTDYGLGAKTDGATKFGGDLAEAYITNEYLDFSVEANRRKFIDAFGKPVDLGSDGSTPTGTAALMFFSGATASWHTNKGSGGGFTETGALTDAASSPSD